MMEDSHLEMDYEDRFISDMDEEDVDPILTNITILDVARAKGANEVNGTINGGEFERLGLPMLSGCEICFATLGPYNAFPSKTGYIRCDDCIDDRGFISVEEFEAFENG